MTFTLIASTGAHFASFGPYVASVNDAGVVAFAATLPDGTSGVFTGTGEEVREAPLPADVRAVRSHPDINDEGALSVYVELATGEQRVVLISRGEASTLADGFAEIGPAGPTMDAHGAVAFRGARLPGVPGVHVVADGIVRTVAEAGGRFGEFFGLPLLESGGAVVFRADRSDGVQGIYRADGEVVRPVVETGEMFAAIAPFPASTAGVLAFAATTAEGEDGVWTLSGEELARAEGGEAFASHRGALIAGDTLVRIATPPGGALGLFRGPDPEADRILGIGDAALGSVVEDLAANAVSVDPVGHLALRISLEDGREAIVRTDVV
ncbi:MAG: hypothetical protein ACM3NW_02590 [Syntrophomonadaceae bacterium]